MANSTDKIKAVIEEQLAKGVIPWTKPWAVRSDGIISHNNGRAYALRNRMLLEYGGEYATFNQIRNAGGRVKKGEHASTVYFSKRIAKTDKDTGEVTDSYWLLRAYSVFRIGSQTEGVEPKYADRWEYGGVPKDDTEVLAVVTAYAERTGVKVLNGGAQAFYSPSDDTVIVPGHGAFTHRAEYWHTVFHELVHSTGAPSRLNRASGNTFGSSEYAYEELVADIGASLCLGRLNIDTEQAIANSGAYCSHWKQRISAFSGAMFSECVRKAEEAMNYIFNTEE